MEARVLMLQREKQKKMLRPKVFPLLLEAIAHGPGIEQFQGQEKGKFRLNMALVLGKGMKVR